MKTGLRDLAAMGVAAGVLPRSELERLFEAKDARLAGIAINGPVATPSLNRSIVRMDAPLVWNAGFQGAYTTSGGPLTRMRIAVVDSGMAKDHPMLLGKVPVENGVSFEACFGTNSNRFQAQYRSVCRGAPPPPSQPGGVAGSFSASGVAGDGEALVATTYCAGQTTLSLCNHGTQVAAIAAGAAVTMASLPNRPGPLTLSGVAPSSNIVPVQAVSLDPSSSGSLAFLPKTCWRR